jgi:hypothetical protein
MAINNREKKEYKERLKITGDCRCNDTGKVCNQCSNNLVIGQRCPSCGVFGTALPGKDTPLGIVNIQTLPDVIWNPTNFAYTDETLTREIPTSNISSADTRVSDGSEKVEAAFRTPLWDDPTATSDEPPGKKRKTRNKKQLEEHNDPAGVSDKGDRDIITEEQDTPNENQPVLKEKLKKHKTTCICGGTGRIDIVDSNQARELIKKIKTDPKILNELVEINSVKDNVERSRRLEELYSNIYACPHNKTNNSDNDTDKE